MKKARSDFRDTGYFYKKLTDSFARQRLIGRRSKSVLLISATSLPAIQLAALYFAAAFIGSRSARPLLFHASISRERRWKRKLGAFRFLIGIGRASKKYALYRTLGVRQILAFAADDPVLEGAESVYRECLRKLRTLRDLEGLEIKGVLVGDLIYDHFVVECRSGTIDLQSDLFREFLWSSVRLTLGWLSFFNANNVAGVVSNAVYLQGIPLRVASKLGIPAYEVFPEAAETRSLSAGMNRTRLEVLSFPEFFETTDPEVREALRDSARNRIESRLRGNKDPRLQNSFQWSSWTASEAEAFSHSLQVGPKVLVAAHRLTDSPHIYQGLFPDYVVWLMELGSMTLGSEATWLIKQHPDSDEGDEPILSEIVSQFPQFKFVSKKIPNSLILSVGVSAVVTCHGTIGMELAYLGIPVINCSANNPHAAYNFNFTPQTLAELKSAILNLESVKINFDRSKILECYYQYNIANWKSFFYDYDSAPTNFVAHVVATWSPQAHSEILDGYLRFIESGEYWFQWAKYGSETSMNRTT